MAAPHLIGAGLVVLNALWRLVGHQEAELAPVSVPRSAGRLRRRLLGGRLVRGSRRVGCPGDVGHECPPDGPAATAALPLVEGIAGGFPAIEARDPLLDRASRSPLARVEPGLLTDSIHLDEQVSRRDDPLVDRSVGLVEGARIAPHRLGHLGQFEPLRMSEPVPLVPGLGGQDEDELIGEVLVRQDVGQAGHALHDLSIILLQPLECLGQQIPAETPQEYKKTLIMSTSLCSRFRELLTNPDSFTHHFHFLTGDLLGLFSTVF